MIDVKWIMIFGPAVLVLCYWVGWFRGARFAVGKANQIARDAMEGC